MGFGGRLEEGGGRLEEDGIEDTGGGGFGGTPFPILFLCWGGDGFGGG